MREQLISSKFSRQKRIEIIASQGNRCAICGKPKSDCRITVHHLRIPRCAERQLGIPPKYISHPANGQAICEEDHRQLHAKDHNKFSIEEIIIGLGIIGRLIGAEVSEIRYLQRKAKYTENPLFRSARRS